MRGAWREFREFAGSGDFGLVLLLVAVATAGSLLWSRVTALAVVILGFLFVWARRLKRQRDEALEQLEHQEIQLRAHAMAARDWALHGRLHYFARQGEVIAGEVASARKLAEGVPLGTRPPGYSVHHRARAWADDVGQELDRAGRSAAAQRFRQCPEHDERLALLQGWLTASSAELFERGLPLPY